MTIRTKLISIGFLSIIGFMSATYLIYVQFQDAMSLKEIELEGVFIQTMQNELSLNSTQFLSDQNLISETYEDWIKAYYEFYIYLKDFTENARINRLGGKLQYLLNQISTGWDSIYNDYYRPINIRLNALVNDETLKKIDTPETSIIDLYELLQSGAIDNKKMESEIAFLEENLSTIDQLMFEINGMFDEVLLEIKSAIAREVMAKSIKSFQLIGVVLAFIVLISTIFSRQTTKNIKKMEKYIAKLAEGDFSANLEIKSRDEFGSLSKDFTLFTETLWEKINSLRDVMRDIGNSISVDLNQQGFIDNIVELAIDSSKADAGIMFSVEEEDRKLVVSNISGYFPPPFQVSRKVSNKKDSLITYFKSVTFDVGQGLIGEVASSGSPVFVRNSYEDDRLPFNSFAEDELYISSMILIPLLVGNRLLGILGVCKTREGQHFSDLDYSFLRSYGEYSAMALDNLNKYQELLSRHELLKELNVASDIQKNLLPENLPALESASLHAYSEAAKGISGDYYDAFKLDENKLLITVCDVAGKGVPASLVMIMIRTILRLITSTAHNARSVVTILNNLLTARLGIDHFATIGLFIYDTEKKVVSYTNGAHHPLYVYKAERDKFVKFDTDGLPLGLEADTIFGHKRFQVSEGDYLVLFTDGLNEARNSTGEEFSTNRLLSIIRNNASLDPVNLTSEIRRNLNAFTEGMDQHDDQTLLLMKIN